MTAISISGKNWILKKFDQDHLLFIKENFYLDEITSKLLSIRKIDKEDINSFLNPSIKNFMPNPNNLLDMDKSTLRVFEAIKASLNTKKISQPVVKDYNESNVSSKVLKIILSYIEFINREVWKK